MDTLRLHRALEALEEAADVFLVAATASKDQAVCIAAHVFANAMLRVMIAAKLPSGLPAEPEETDE